MHIGYVLKKFPRISETFILNEILELERQGAQVTVFSLNRPSDGKFHRRLSELKGEIVYMPQRKTQAALEHLHLNIETLRAGREGIWQEFEGLLGEGRSDMWSVLKWGVEIATLVQTYGIDHLHAHFATVATYVSRVANSMLGTPYSFTCHAKDIYREGVSSTRFQRLASRASFIVTVCEANRQYIATELAGDGSLPVHVIYNGVDLDLFNPYIREPETEPLVLGVGRLVEKKGFDKLVSAVSELSASGTRLRCVIIGDGEMRESLESQIRECGCDSIELIGLRTQDETREFMAKATVLALPCIIGSDGNRDALPTVLLEALACGLPVISTPIVGVEEIVDNGRAGVLVPPGDSTAVARAIGDLIKDPARRESLSQLGRKRAELCFDQKKNVAVLLTLFEGITA